MQSFCLTNGNCWQPLPDDRLSPGPSSTGSAPLVGAFPMKVHRARVERPPRTTGGRERATRVGEGCAVNQPSYESRRVWRYTVAGCLGVIVAVTGNTPAHPC